MAKVSIINRSGERHQVDVSMNDYREAAAAGRTLAQHLEHKHGATADTSKYGSVFKQMAESAGIYKPDPQRGLRSPKVGEIILDKAAVGGSIGSPDGSDTTPAGRILFPEIIMDTMREKLEVAEDDILSGWDSMIAYNESINGDIYVQPKIDTTHNEDTRSQVTSQLALPPAMVNITTSQVTKTIQTKSVGLMISEQALNHTTLDLVAIAVAAQTRGERIAMAYQGMSRLMSGDKDVGTAALTPEKLQDYDSAISAAGEATHKGFLHLLYDHRKTLSIDSAIMDIDTYLAFEGRSGRPIQTGDAGTDSRLNMNFRPMNFDLTDLNILLVDTDVYGANTAMFFDSRFAIRKVTNLNASYEAILEFVMRRATGLRMDYGYHVDRLYDAAFKPISLTV
ncbi:TPA: hypothetical protein NGR52_004193 [Vibrio parahaemolyticus]|nr:hypothetical protein [Vibrio parahaemolyticus]